MSAIQEPFEIAYCGVSIKVTRVVNKADMLYVVRLPTRTVIIEKEFDANGIDCWEELKGGRTILAEEIGAIIESRIGSL